MLLRGLLVVGSIIAFAAFAGCTVDDIRRLFAPPQPTPAPIVVVITATPVDTPTGTSTPIPTLPPTSTSAPVLALVPTHTATHTHTPTPTPTLRPTFTPTATKTPLPTATGTSTSTPTITPTITPTAFVCGYAEMVLIGAGKKHKHCHTPTPVPVSTATPIPTNTPRAVVIPIHTSTSVSITQAGQIPTVAPTPSLPPTLAPIPTQPSLASPTALTSAAQTASPHLRYIEEKQYMLELINAERKKAGVPEVELGDNIAAQLHAESSLANCFSSHWGIDGLKPYMRYSLAGGYQSNGENASGYDYCVKAGDGYRAIRSIKEEIRETMDGWMNSPGHRRTIVNKDYMKVNIGLAWDRFHLFAYQHFESDYVVYSKLPSIENNILQVGGSVKGGAKFGSKDDLSVQIYYDAPPHELTRGQLSEAGCYSFEPPVASLRPPLTAGWSYNDSEIDFGNHATCKSPYDVSVDTPAPSSPSWFSFSPPPITLPYPVNWITASKWTAKDSRFSATADISDVLEEHGNGVYTIAVWGNIDGEDIVISEYSIFHGITPPDTYTPRLRDCASAQCDRMYSR